MTHCQWPNKYDMQSISTLPPLAYLVAFIFQIICILRVLRVLRVLHVFNLYFFFLSSACSPAPRRRPSTPNPFPLALLPGPLLSKQTECATFDPQVLGADLLEGCTSTVKAGDLCVKRWKAPGKVLHAR